MIMISSKRLLLREFVPEDADSLFPILSDKETMAFYPAPFSKEKVENWIRKSIDSYQQNGFGLWAVILKETNELIGDCGITLQEIEGKQLPELGYHIRKDHWNKGFATEAAKAVMEFAFCTCNLPRLYTYTSTENEPSKIVAIKNGMSFVKYFQKTVMGRIVQEVLYCVSQDEYCKLNRKNAGTT